MKRALERWSILAVTLFATIALLSGVASLIALIPGDGPAKIAIVVSASDLAFGPLLALNALLRITSLPPRRSDLAAVSVLAVAAVPLAGALFAFFVRQAAGASPSGRAMSLLTFFNLAMLFVAIADVWIRLARRCS